jgi:hypothetical protein
VCFCFSRQLALRVCALRSSQAHLQRVLGAVLLPLGEAAQGRRAQGEDPHAYVLRPPPPSHT